MSKPYYPNRDDWEEDFWGRKYRILVSRTGCEFLVSASCTQDAIDYVIDACVEHFPGLVLTHKQERELIDDATNDLLRKRYGDDVPPNLTENQLDEMLTVESRMAYLDEYISGGNENRYLSTHNVRIKEIV